MYFSVCTINVHHQYKYVNHNISPPSRKGCMCHHFLYLIIVLELFFRVIGNQPQSNSKAKDQQKKSLQHSDDNVFLVSF